MVDFQSWINNNNLFRFPTSGARFTCSNKRDCPFSVERGLDHFIENSPWVDACNCIMVSTLTKVYSDHHPFLLEFHINSARLMSQFKFIST